MFAIYLLIALAVRLVDWSKVEGILRVACILLLVFAAFWQMRSTFRTYLGSRENVAAADLAAVSQWARHHTRPDDLFLFDSAAFRVMAQRSMAFTTKDGDAAVFHRPDRAAAWQERMEAMRAAGDDPQALLAAGIRFGAQYVVVPARRLPANPPDDQLKYRNGTFAVLAAGSR